MILHECLQLTNDLLFKLILFDKMFWSLAGTMPLISLIKIIKIDSFFIPNYTLMSKTCILRIYWQFFANLHLLLSLVIAQLCGTYWQHHSLCRCWLMVLVKDQVLLTIYECLSLALGQPFQARIHLPQQEVNPWPWFVFAAGVNFFEMSVPVLWHMFVDSSLISFAAALESDSKL